MKKCVNGQYIEMTQEEIDELNNSIDSSSEPTIEDRVSTLEQYQSPKFINSIELVAENWVGNESPYSQVVEINGVTQNSKVDLQPNTEQLSIFYEKDLSFVAANEGGVVTVFCIGQKPMNDYTMQVTVTEVIVNE